MLCLWTEPIWAMLVSVTRNLPSTARNVKPSAIWPDNSSLKLNSHSCSIWLLKHLPISAHSWKPSAEFFTEIPQTHFQVSIDASLLLIHSLTFLKTEPIRNSLSFSPPISRMGLCVFSTFSASERPKLLNDSSGSSKLEVWKILRV